MNTIVTVKEGALEGVFSDDKQSVIFKGRAVCCTAGRRAALEASAAARKMGGCTPRTGVLRQSAAGDLSKWIPLRQGILQ